MNAPRSNRLPELAAHIHAAHLAVETAAKTAADRAIEAGQALIEAKALLKHGEWLPWLKANCQISQRSAHLYMHLARSGVKSATVADLGLRGAAKALIKLEPVTVSEMTVIIPGTSPRDINALVGIRESTTSAGFFNVSGLIFQRGEATESFTLRRPIRADMVAAAVSVAVGKEITAEQWNEAVDRDLGGSVPFRVSIIGGFVNHAVDRVDIGAKLAQLLAAGGAA